MSYIPPQGTAGAVQFNSSSVLGADSANLSWDDSNNRLGILTSAPSASLSIGASSQLQVNASGALVKLNNATVPVATYVVTNLTTSRSLNADTLVLGEVADVLGTLIADLRTLGIIA